MNEGETSGAPMPVDTSQNNETPAAAPVFSAPADGEAPAAPAEQSAANNTESSQNIASRAFGFKARSRRNTAARVEANYAAAQNIANNPNTPEFFGDAMRAAAPASEPKRSKKPLVIGGIAGAILVVIAIVVLSLSFGNNPLNKGRFSAAKSTFLALANYYLYAQDSEEELVDSYDPDATYAAKKNASNKEYYAKLNELYNNFNDKISPSIESGDDSADDEVIRRYLDSLKLIISANTVVFDEGAIFEAYKASGEKGIEEYRNRTESALEGAFGLSAEYKNNLSLYAEKSGEFFTLLKNSNCLDTYEDTDLYCIYETKDEQLISQVNSLLKELDTIEISLETAARDQYNIAAQQSWVIQSILNGEESNK